jgi:hypothetical protein
MLMQLSCGCCGGCTVGFWGTCDQITWAAGIQFPTSWTILGARDKDNLTDCNILVVGRYSFAAPYTDEPLATADRTAVADWITAGGVLFVIHDYYGSPSIIPVTPVDSLNAFLAAIGSQARAVTTTSGGAPNNTDFPVGTHTTSVSHPLLAGVDKLFVSAPGFMSLGSATLLFEARRLPGGYASILSVESYGQGSIVFCADASMINNSTAASHITTHGNKINKLLENLCALSAN